MSKPFSKPKGWRSIVVDGEKWYWTRASGLQPLIVRDALTGAKHAADHVAMDHLQRELGAGKWDEYHECAMIEPRHVEGFIKQLQHWTPMVPSSSN